MELKADIFHRDLAISALAIGLIYWFFPHYFMLIIGGVVILLGLFFFSVRKMNHVFWDRFTKGMQWVVQPILGTLIFFLILVPIGLLWRLFKKKKELSNSTFRPMEQKIGSDFFEKQW